LTLWMQIVIVLHNCGKEKKMHFEKKCTRQNKPNNLIYIIFFLIIGGYVDVFENKNWKHQRHLKTMSNSVSKRNGDLIR